MTLRKLLTRILLAALNSRWLNSTPCRYGFIVNADAFDLENLRAEARSRPELSCVSSSPRPSASPAVRYSRRSW